MAVAAADVAALAAAASDRFARGEYRHALDILLALVHERPQSSRLLHNVAVARHYLDESAPQRTVDALGDVLRSRKDAAGADEHDMDDAGVAMYNQAVLLAGDNQLERACELLRELIAAGGAGKATAVKASFMLLDAQLRMEDAAGAAATLDGIESRFGGELAGVPHASAVVPGLRGFLLHDSFAMTLHVMRARLHLVQRSPRAAQREIKQALALNHESGAATVVKAHMEFLRHNPRKAVKLLTTTERDHAHDLAPFLHNDLGAVHLRAGNYAAAQLYLWSAFQEEPDLDPRLRAAVARQRDAALPDLLINMGHAQLFGGQPEQALACFARALAVRGGSALLWLRAGEAAIASYAAAQTAHATAVNVVDDGVIVLPIADSRVGNVALAEAEPSLARTAGDGASMSLLEYAHACMGNVLLLAGRASPAAAASERRALVEHALLNDAYVLLAMGAYASALGVLSRLPSDASTGALLLADLYAADALIHDGRVAWALRRLQAAVERIGALPADQQPVDTLTAVRINMAAAHMLLGDLPRAHALLQPLTADSDADGPFHRELVLLLVYMALRQGDRARARSLLVLGRLAPARAEAQPLPR